MTVAGGTLYFGADDGTHALAVLQRPSGVLSVGVVGSVAGLILGLACIGYGVFQLVAPRRHARLGVRYHRWWYARIPWLYQLPTMKRLLDEDRQARATRLYGPLFVAMGLLFTVRAVIAAVSAI